MDTQKKIYRWDDFSEMLVSVMKVFSAVYDQNLEKFEHQTEVYLVPERWGGLNVSLYWKETDDIQRNVEAEIDLDGFHAGNLLELDVYTFARQNFYGEQGLESKTKEEKLVRLPLPLDAQALQMLQAAVEKGLADVSSWTSADLT